VVLSPAAVVEVLEWMAMASFGGRALLDGTSLLAGRHGQPLCDERVTIVDDPGYAHPAASSCPFDAEGTVRLPVTMIDRGRAGDAVTDLASAARLKDPRGSTGHAAVGDLVDGAMPANLVFLPGADSVPEMIARVERGLYVTRFHYVNGLLDTRRATMTGMTRDGTFLIEHGRLGRAVRNLRFTESMLDAFSRLGGIGRELQAIPTTWLAVGAYLAPALLLRAFTFTGRSR
jgi:predicted Zn-dependent protease